MEIRERLEAFFDEIDRDMERRTAKQIMMEGEYASAIDDITDLRTKLKAKDTKINELRAKLTEANAEIERLGDELTEARERIAELEKKGKYDGKFYT